MLDRLRDLQQLEGVAGNCENWPREFRVIDILVDFMVPLDYS